MKYVIYTHKNQDRLVEFDTNRSDEECIRHVHLHQRPRSGTRIATKEEVEKVSSEKKDRLHTLALRTK